MPTRSAQANRNAEKVIRVLRQAQRLASVWHSAADQGAKGHRERGSLADSRIALACMNNSNNCLGDDINDEATSSDEGRTAGFPFHLGHRRGGYRQCPANA